jgi:hypothetical protein
LDAHDARLVADDRGRRRTRIGKIVGLARLVPYIVTAAVEGRQPVSLTTCSIMSIKLPLAWRDEREMLGIS